MSAFAQRMHCRTCSALMNNASVRIRKINKRRRGKGERSRNVVVRKCHDCGAHNAENGSITRCRPTADRSEVQELVNDAKRRIRRGDKDRTRNIDPQIGEDLKNGNNLGVEKGRVKKKKKRKGKRLRDGKSDGSSSAPPSGLAASFLFEPIN